MENKQNIITMLTLLTTLNLTQNATAQNNTPIKINNTLTAATTNKDYNITREEMLVKNLPANSDIYLVAEQFKANKFFKARLQVMPLSTGPFSFGITGKYTYFNSKNDVDHGIVARLQGKPTKETFGKVDIRYFPDSETFTIYGFLDSKNWFFDILLGSYNHETQQTSLLPGIDYKINSHLSVGIETKLTGKDLKLNDRYFGGRLKINF